MPKQSPFPGMDPYLEGHWHDVHASLMVTIRNEIADQLPDDLIVSIEQSITLGDESGHKRGDVDVSTWGNTADWKEDWHPDYENFQSADGTDDLAVPVLLTSEEIPHRYLEVRSVKSGREVITVIEVLSPSNKVDKTSVEYRQKRDSYLGARMNFVEIDLLRQGQTMYDPLEHWTETPPHSVFVKRFAKAPEFYPIRYQDHLPQFLVPLRPKDQPVTLNLQAAIDECYRAGQYWKRIDYQKDKISPAPSEELSDWIASL